jgi:stalled ribosome rescue protein Dom34
LSVAAAAAAGIYYYFTSSPRGSSSSSDTKTQQQPPQRRNLGANVPPQPGEDPAISKPLNLSKPFSIKYDPVRKRFEGVPDEVRQKIYSAGYTDEQVFQNPDLVKDILDNIDYDTVNHNNISHPVGFQHNVHITINENGIQGLPTVIRDAINKKGITDEQIIRDPSIVQDLIYSFTLEEVLKDHLPKISKPFGVTHDFSITYDSKTGQVKGVPEPVVLAIKNAGHSLEEVIKNPQIIRDLIYNLDYEEVKEATKPQVSTPSNFSHDFHLTFDKDGKVIGIPEPIRKACIQKGITEEEVLKNPACISDILYSFDYEEVKKTHKLN